MFIRIRKLRYISTSICKKKGSNPKLVPDAAVDFIIDFWEGVGASVPREIIQIFILIKSSFTLCSNDLFNLKKVNYFLDFFYRLSHFILSPKELSENFCFFLF